MIPFGTRQSIDPNLPIVAAEGHHTCRMCGGGCRSYDVMLTEREAHRLDLDLWRPLLNAVPDDVPLVKLDEATRQYTLSKIDDRCVFLDTDNLCIIHKSSGAAAKPIACQLFPRQVVVAPDGLHLSLNVGCRRLVEMTDADDLPDFEEARRLLDSVQAVTTIGDNVPLTPTLTISYAEFTSRSAELLTILGSPAADWPTIWQNMRVAAALLLTIPNDAPADGLPGVAPFDALRRLIGISSSVRPTLMALYWRTEGWLGAIGEHGLRLPALDNLAAPPGFVAVVAQQYLDGDQAALHRTARTGWVALLMTIIGGLHGAAWRIEHAGERADHALNEALSDALDLTLSPAGQLALTEPNQIAFLRALSEISV